MRRKLNESTFVLLLAAAGLAGGCRPAPTMDVWVAGEMIPLTDRTVKADDLTVFNPDQKTINLFGAANETISFQLVIEGGPTGLEDLRITWSPLGGPDKGKIGPENLRAFRMLPVKITEFPAWYVRLAEEPPEPANFYDALLPIDSKGTPSTWLGAGVPTWLGTGASTAPAAGAQPFKLAPNERLAVWMDLYIPRDARSGDYAGELKLSGIRSGEYSSALPSSAVPHVEWQGKLAVQVYDFVLPDSRPLAAVGGFDHDALFAAFLRRDGQPYVPANLDRTNPLVRQGLQVMRQLMVLSYQHRLDLFDRTIRPVMKRGPSGEVALDWTDYDAIVTPYLSGSAFGLPVGCAAWCVPWSDEWPSPGNYGGEESPEYAGIAEALLKACRRHFLDLNVAGQMFYWPHRGEVSAEAYQKHARLARIARSADPDTPILAALPPEPPQETRWKVPPDFTRLADIFAPPGHWLDPNVASRARRAHPLSGAWLAPGQPPYVPSLAVSASPADARALPWFAMKYGCTGLLLAEVLNWSGDPFHTPAGAETRLFYPGSAVGVEEVLPSVRLKRLRRGLQDIAYLWLLRQRERAGVARAMVDTMTRYAGLAAIGDNYLDVRVNGWVQDPTAWEVARRLLAEEVHAAIHPSDTSARRLLLQRVEWKKLEDRALSVRVEQVRSRVTPVVSAPGQRGDRLRATVLLDLFNEYNRDVDCLVKLDKLPEGWKALEGEVRLSPLPPASRKTVTLTAEGDYVPSSANARLPLPVRITADMQRQQLIECFVPFLVAGQAKAPPRIDGRLGDWPTRPGNAAADFKLVGRRGERGDGLAKRQTVAFVLRDPKNLYIALRCEEPNPPGMVVQPDNLVRYQQLMACGEELVEIILDPGAAARGPEELYHLVIKPSGVLIGERGIGSTPPLGEVRTWPSGASVAVGREEKVWIVELAIPLSAFGAAGGAEFWGVNFARFASQGAESSSWSGAPRYFYDPRNLGTMFTPPPPKEQP